MQKALWTGLLILVGISIAVFPRVKDSWQQRQAMEKLGEAGAQVAKDFEATARVIEQDNEQLTDAQYQEVVRNIINQKDSEAAGDALYKIEHLSAVDQQALVDVVVEKKDAAAAQQALYFSKKLTASQKVALQTVVKK